MTIRFFEGPAGCGKTTALVDEVASQIASEPLGEGQRVLALTRMHGSRRRMHQRLEGKRSIRGQFDCLTVDSFAWHLLRRWRSLAAKRFGDVCGREDFDETCRRAGEILRDVAVHRWVTRRYPVVMVDELQDNNGGRLEIIKALADSARCWLAADAYQDLGNDGDNEAVEWAKGVGESVVLMHCWRTSSAGLLAGARAIREGLSVRHKSSGLTILGAPSSDVGASFVANNLTWWGTRGTAVLCTAGAPKSLFVGGVLDRVGSGPIGKNGFGPFRIRWETAPESHVDAFLNEIGLLDNRVDEVVASQLALPDGNPISKSLSDWFDRQRRLAARASFTRDEIRAQVELIQQRWRAQRKVSGTGARAMTIHQAKNREFASVIVLWPYEVTGSPGHLRRLLYNAITRARERAVVVVQDPKGDRLKKPPFAA